MKHYFPYYLVKFFFDFILLYPLYVLIIQNRGMSEGSIAWLLALWSLSVVLLELPMGVLSDRCSRRKILLMASLSKALAFLVWIPARSFAMFTLGFILWGLSEALASGTEEAWLYENLAEQGQEGAYEKIKGRGTFFSSIGIGTASVLGGLGIEYGETFILVISVLASLVSAVGILFFGNPPRTASPDEEAETEQAFIPMLRSAFSDILQSRPLLILILFASFVLLVPGVLEEWDPVFLSSLGITPVWLGVWLAVRYGCESLGSLFAHRGARFLPGIKSMLSVAALSALVLPALGISGSFWLLPFYGLYYAVYALLGVLTEGKMQNLLLGSRRATLMSIKSLLDNLVGILMILSSGYLAEAQGWPIVWISGGIFIIVFCMILFFPRSLVQKQISP